MENRSPLTILRRLLSRFFHLRGKAHAYWGNRLMDMQEYMRAVDDLSRALRLDPTFTEALYLRGVIFWRELGDAQRADRDLTGVLAQEPDHLDALFNRALARQLGNNAAGAAADFRRYLEEGHDPMWRQVSQRQLLILADGEEAE
jgi:tetratricopeptide (TPR) repeat protein